MAFISYAQNCEDVMLWRALRDVEQGFYVDVGAADPEIDSVTRAFYERGWSGINVEPLDEYFERLQQARPRDTNLKVAAGREAGVRTLHVFSGTGLSTLDQQIGARHQAAGMNADETVVPVLPLTKILEDRAQSTIHFLKIDVEGVEAEVLEGLDLNRVRPWIIVVEATEPNSPESSRHKWESLITDRGYSLVYFDGLNCFYVADEVPELKERLRLPPNVHDDFVRRSEWVLENTVAGLKGHAGGLEAALGAATGQAERTQEALTLAHQETARLQQTLRLEQARNAELRAALASEQAHAAAWREALKTEQTHSAELQCALLAQQAQVDTLLASIRRFGDELIERSAGKRLLRSFQRIRETGDQLTGGGARALVKRLWINSVRRTGPLVMGYPPTAALARGVLRPFPRVTTYLYRLANPGDTRASNEAVPLPAGLAEVNAAPIPPGGESPPATLPVTARRIYLRLKTAVAQNNTGVGLR